MCEPQLWERPNGGSALVVTPATIRAQDLVEVYKGLRYVRIRRRRLSAAALCAEWPVDDVRLFIGRQAAAEEHGRAAGCPPAGEVGHQRRRLPPQPRH
eukprot:scaffold1807_cov175-Prasinococcus_capsulatus_cf.AAC.1